VRLAAVRIVISVKVVNYLRSSIMTKTLIFGSGVNALSCREVGEALRFIHNLTGDLNVKQLIKDKTVSLLEPVSCGSYNMVLTILKEYNKDMVIISPEYRIDGKSIESWIIL
jgi:hypothetical protein